MTTKSEFIIDTIRELCPLIASIALAWQFFALCDSVEKIADVQVKQADCQRLDRE